MKPALPEADPTRMTIPVMNVGDFRTCDGKHNDLDKKNTTEKERNNAEEDGRTDE